MPEQDRLGQRLRRALVLAPEVAGWDGDDEARRRLLPALRRRRARRLQVLGAVVVAVAAASVPTTLALTASSSPAERSASSAVPSPGRVAPTGCVAIAVGDRAFECAGTLSTEPSRTPAGTSSGAAAIPSYGSATVQPAERPVSVGVGDRLTVVLPAIRGATWEPPQSGRGLRVLSRSAERSGRATVVLGAVSSGTTTIGDVARSDCHASPTAGSGGGHRAATACAVAGRWSVVVGVHR